jgi:hypothetical protein
MCIEHAHEKNYFSISFFGTRDHKLVFKLFMNLGISYSFTNNPYSIN